MKLKVGIFMGGYSPEAGISLQSGMMVYNHLDPKLFDVYKVEISKDRWVASQGDLELAVDKGSLSFNQDGVSHHFDVIFNAIHGHPGEDGYLQALFELNGIPHSSSPFFESALTFNKHKTNTLLKALNIKVPKSKFLVKSEEYDTEAIGNEFGFPLFIKPNRSGSSFGVTRVNGVDEIEPALESAFKEDDQALIEEAIIGREIGCGVVKHNGKTEAIALTEIISKRAFFDYEAKYEGASEEITPAGIDDNLYAKITTQSERIYNYLNLWGISRIDYILRDSVPYLIEINTIPGLSSASIVPQQIAHRNWDLTSFFGGLLLETIEKFNKK